MAQVQSVGHTCTQTCSLCFFSNPICPLLIQRIFHLLVSTLFSCFQLLLFFSQEAVHSRSMSREATQCARQRCSANLHSLAEPGPLFGHGSAGLKSYTLRNCKLPHTLERRRNILFHVCAQAGAPWALTHESFVSINVRSHHKLPLDDVNSRHDDE